MITAIISGQTQARILGHIMTSSEVTVFGVFFFVCAKIVCLFLAKLRKLE